jgi:hypothetical protein
MVFTVVLAGAGAVAVPPEVEPEVVPDVEPDVVPDVVPEVVPEVVPVVPPAMGSGGGVLEVPLAARAVAALFSALATDCSVVLAVSAPPQPASAANSAEAIKVRGQREGLAGLEKACG